MALSSNPAARTRQLANLGKRTPEEMTEHGRRGARASGWYGHRWSDEELLTILREAALEDGSPPTQKAFKSRHPTDSCYVGRFGSWRKAIIAAGFVPRAQGEHLPGGSRRGRGYDRANRDMVTAGAKGSRPVAFDPGSSVESLRTRNEGRRVR